MRAARSPSGERRDGITPGWAGANGFVSRASDGQHQSKVDSTSPWKSSMPMERFVETRPARAIQAPNFTKLFPVLHPHFTSARFAAFTFRTATSYGHDSATLGIRSSPVALTASLGRALALVPGISVVRKIQIYIVHRKPCRPS